MLDLIKILWDPIFKDIVPLKRDPPHPPPSLLLLKLVKFDDPRLSRSSIVRCLSYSPSGCLPHMSKDKNIVQQHIGIEKQSKLYMRERIVHKTCVKMIVRRTF